MASIHEGHRERLKKRFLSSGLDSFEKHNALELLLFYSIPRGDTNPVAHELMLKFGSFSSVLNATEEQLLQVKGIGANSAGLLRLIPEISKRYTMDTVSNNKTMNSSKEFCDYIEKYYEGETGKKVSIICMDGKHKLLGCVEIKNMDIQDFISDKSMIFETFLKYNTWCAVIVHNRLNGDFELSKEDVDMTKELIDLTCKIDVTLLDHIVLCEGMCISIRNSYPWIFN